MLPFNSRGGPRRGGLRGALLRTAVERSHSGSTDRKKKKKTFMVEEESANRMDRHSQSDVPVPVRLPPGRGVGGWGCPWKVANLHRESSSADQSATKRRSAG